MSSPEGGLPAEHVRTLLEVARSSIEHGLHMGEPLEVEPSEFPAPLRESRALFVTLRCRGELRGCTGTLEAREPLVANIARIAWRSAFADPRFPPLRAPELDGLELRISVLSPLEPLKVASEPDLLARLRPKIDGLLLREGERHSTFLPAVWESLPEPREFVAELKRKAGLPPAYWSDALVFFRYTAETFP